MSAASDSLKSRMQQATSAAPSMVPQPPPVKEKEPPPSDIRELVLEEKDQEEVTRLIKDHIRQGEIETAARRAKQPLTDGIKRILAAWEVRKATYQGARITYFGAYRQSIDRSLLLRAGVSPDTILACTVSTPSYTLRITPPGADDDEDNKW